MDNIREFKPKKSSFVKYLKFLIGAYVLGGVILFLGGNLIFDVTLSIFYVIGIFVVVSIAYSVDDI